MSLLRFVERKGTDSSKWDIFHTKCAYKKGDFVPIICAWVADMDFVCPQPITDAVLKVLHSVPLGYNMPAENLKTVIKDWIYKQFGWLIHPSWLIFQPGVCPGVAIFVQAFAKPGEKCVVFTPVYHPCIHTLEDNGVIILGSDLVYNKETRKFEINFDDFEVKIRDPLTKIFIFVNPHNPTGRDFTRMELERIGKLCLENGVVVCSDEIHWDFILGSPPFAASSSSSSSSSSSQPSNTPRTSHIPFASLSPEIAAITITFSSLSKTFNCSSYQFSYAIISNPKLKAQYLFQSQKFALFANTTLGGAATVAAYTHTQCDEWYLQVLDLVRTNVHTPHRLLGVKYKEYVSVVNVEGTYLVFIDFRDACVKLGFPHNYDFVTGKPLEVPNVIGGKHFDARSATALRDFIFKECGVLMNDGASFGRAGDGWVRMNVATKSTVVEEACGRIAELLDKEIERVEKEKEQK